MNTTMQSQHVQKELNEEDCRKSRTLFILEGSASNVVVNLTGGAFLAGYSKYLGASDQFSGIIGAIPALAGLIQLFAPMVFEKRVYRKPLVAAICLFYRLLLGCMGFIPLLVSHTGARLSILAGMYLLAYLCASFITPAVSDWIIRLTPEQIRGAYFGKKDSYILAFTTIITLVMGRVLDSMTNAGHRYWGFAIVFSVAVVFALVNFIFLIRIAEPGSILSQTSTDLRRTLTIPLQDRHFRRVIGLFVLWNISIQIGLAFFTVYMVSGLKLEYTYIMTISMIGSIAGIITVRMWGRLADRRSWVFTTQCGIGMLAICHILWFFIVPGTVFLLIPIVQIMGGIAWAGINISLFNIQFMFSPQEGRTMYLGFNAALGGTIGFGSAMLGAYLVGRLNGIALHLGLLTVGNMQIVLGLSGVLLLLCVVYIRRYLGQGEKITTSPDKRNEQRISL